ncbi:MAG: NB-ARC domain-containing protein, partial [Myxococcota bacterium]
MIGCGAQCRPGAAVVGEASCLALVQVVGAAALAARVPAAFARAEVVLRQAVDAVAADAGGRIVPSSTRGLLVQFDEPAPALRFACRLQEVLVDADWPATLLVRPEAAVERGEGIVLFRGPRVRVALHRGRAELEQAIGIEGPAVYQIARIASIAHGGQVVMSSELHDALPPVAGVVIRPLGPHVLDGVDGESELHEAQPSLLADRTFPELASQSHRRSNLPTGEEGASGRFGDLGALTELLAFGVRVVSITGPTGVGKSVLLRQFARARMVDPRFTGGTWLARLEASSVGALVRSVGWALGVPLDEAASPEAAIDQLRFALTARGRLLVAIDGYGTLDPQGVGVVDRWSRAASLLTLVVGTERRLAIDGEVAYELRPLPIPMGDNLRNADAVRLYANHARGVDEDFAVEDPAVVAQLVERMKGRPLPVRLLAGFVDRLPPDQQLDRVVAGSLDARGLLDLLLDLLDPEETAVLLAGSALRGSFDVRAIDDLGSDPLPVVVRLERRGLVRAHPDLGAPQVHRYAVDTRIREHVLSRLPPEDRQVLGERRAHQLVRWCERLAQ